MSSLSGVEAFSPTILLDHFLESLKFSPCIICVNGKWFLAIDWFRVVQPSSLHSFQELLLSGFSRSLRTWNSLVGVRHYWSFRTYQRLFVIFNPSLRMSPSDRLLGIFLRFFVGLLWFQFRPWDVQFLLLLLLTLQQIEFLTSVFKCSSQFLLPCLWCQFLHRLFLYII